MAQKTAAEIQRALAQPFAPEDLEWRLQKAYEEQMRGIAVPYVTNRAIQNRLDEVVGADNWYNDYKPWHGAGKKEAQICGISIYFEGRGFITKWDGAEDTDIEPVKGGLSDSMKRAAVQWGIGRVLYNMDSVWVGIEKKGKSIFIKDSERAKLDNEYLKMLDRLHLKPVAAGGAQSQLTPSETAEAKAAVTAEQTTRSQPAQAQSPSAPAQPTPAIPQETAREPERIPDLMVLGAKQQPGMSGVSTSLMLQTPEGAKLLGFVRGAHPELASGVKLFNVKKTLRKKDSVVYYELDSFEAEDTRAA